MNIQKPKCAFVYSSGTRAINRLRKIKCVINLLKRSLKELNPQLIGSSFVPARSRKALQKCEAFLFKPGL
jgi:hypothetical protein